MRIRLLVFLSFVVSVYSCLSAQGDSCRIEVKWISDPVLLNGRADESFWRDITPGSGFIQNFPTDSLVAKSVTSVRMAYDKKNIYVFAEMFDSSSKPFVVQSLKRDFSITRSDAFIVSVSPQRDKTNGFSFGVNPYGVQREGLIALGGLGGVTTAWDNKWFCETLKGEGLWTVEMQIPLKTVRYKKGSQDWDVNFSRIDFKRNENSSWSRIPRSFNLSALGFAGQMHFEKPLDKAGANLVFIPYLTGGASFRRPMANSDERVIRNLANAGFDAKVGLSSSLNLDLTVNPDFSQVEIDDQVVNLDRFEVFFPERRQFFIENSDLFDAFGFSKIRPFFSRRIGLVQGRNIPIIGAARLSGNINRNWRIGLMDLQTLKEKELNISPENFLVAAVQRRLFDRSNLGLILVSRNTLQPDKNALENHNSVAGIDFNLYSKDNRWRGKFFYHHSFGKRVHIDGNANASWLQYRTSSWNVQWNHEYVGRYYNASVGFVPRIGYFRLEPSVGYTFFMKKGSKLFSITPTLYYSQYWLLDGFVSSDRINQALIDFSFMNTALLSMNFTDQQTRLTRTFDPTGKKKHEVVPGNYRFRSAGVSYTSNFRRRFTYLLSCSGGTYFDLYRIGYVGSLSYRFQPYGSITGTLERYELLLKNGSRAASITLAGSKLDVSFTRDLFFTGILQYNTQQNVFNINARLQWRYKPMSDLFIVYSDNYDDLFKNRIRAFQIKWTYWLNI